MDIKQIQELVKLINKTNIGEITIEEEGIKITVKQKKDPVQHIIAGSAAPAYAPPVAPQPQPLPAKEAAKPAAETEKKPENPAV